MKKLNQLVKFISFFVLSLFLLFSCRKDDMIDSNSNLKTASKGEVLSFLDKRDSLAKRGSNYLTYDLKKLTYEDIINTKAKLAVIPAKTKNEKQYSRILMLRVRGKLQAVVFNMSPNRNMDKKGKFSGEITINSLEGNILRAFRVKDNNFTYSYQKVNVSSEHKSLYSYRSEDSDDSEECRKECGHSADDKDCICNMQFLEAVEITGSVKKTKMDSSTFTSRQEGNGGTGAGGGWWNPIDDTFWNNFMEGWREGKGGSGLNVNKSKDEIINNLEGKAECIYSKLNFSSTKFKNMIKKFDGKFPVSHLKFESRDLPDGVRGITEPPINYVITIAINNDSSESGVDYRPNLLTVKTIVHEVVHAEMFRKLLSLSSTNGMINVSTLNEMLEEGDYPGMLDYYTRFGVNGFQHQQMAQHYRQTIANILKVYDNDQHSEQFYKDLAWEGLNHSNIISWQNVFSQEERDRIDKVIKDYINDNKNENCQR